LLRIGSKPSNQFSRAGVILFTTELLPVDFSQSWPDPLKVLFERRRYFSVSE
jgi:hypothetical protein